MTKAILLHEYGGAENLRWESIPTPKPGPGEVLVRHAAVGLNYIDIYHRTGLYPVPKFPAILGYEAAGIVEAVGQGVTRVKPGARVAYCLGPLGAYAEMRVIPERFIVAVPEEISLEIAAAALLKGQTAHYLLQRTFIVQRNVTMLVHAAAGGVGVLLCQWGKHLGATVIGTVGSAEKAKIARENGCHHVILYREEDVAARVMEITGGKGVNVVYDAVGKDTFMASLDSLTRFGLMVSYGQASGPIPPFDSALLAQKGSLYFTRPTLMHYKDDEAEYIAGAITFFKLLAEGVLKMPVGQSYYLRDAAMAHRDLEARKTTGASVLLVG